MKDLNKLKEEINEMNKKLSELTEEEFELVTGGSGNISWQQDNNLPTEPGNYKVGGDVVIDDKYKPIN